MLDDFLPESKRLRALVLLASLFALSFIEVRILFAAVKKFGYSPGSLLLIVLLSTVPLAMTFSYSSLLRLINEGPISEERSRLVPYDEFIEEYSDRITITETDVGRLDIVEELSLLKDAKEIRVNVTPKLYDPTVIKELLGGARMSLEEDIKRKRIATRVPFPIRVTSRNDEEINAERVPYHYAYAIHYSPDFVISDHANVRVRDALRPLLYKGEVLRPLEESPLPNHLGVQILAFTKDGYAVLLKRGGEGMVAARYALSVIEGTVETRGIDRLSYTLHELAMQEIEEEIGVNECELYAISYYRSPRILGRPSIGFIGLLNATSEELRPSWEGEIVLVKVADRVESLEDLKRIDMGGLIEKAREGSPTLKRLVVKLKRIRESSL